MHRVTARQNMSYLGYTLGSWKYAHPFFHTLLLWGKNGEGAFARIFISSHANAPPAVLTYALDNHDNWHDSLEERQLHWMCTTGNQWHLGLYYAKRHRSNFHRKCRDRGRPHVSSRSQCERHKTWIQSMTELNQKLTESIPRRRLIRGVYTRENYPM